MNILTKPEPRKTRHYLIPASKKLYRLIDQYNKLIDNKQMKGQEALAKKILEVLNGFTEYVEKNKKILSNNERIRKEKK